MEGPALPSQGAGCWVVFATRKQHVDAILQRKDSKSRSDINWDEFETPHSCWQQLLDPRMWVCACDFFLFFRLYVFVCTCLFLFPPTTYCKNCVKMTNP